MTNSQKEKRNKKVARAKRRELLYKKVSDAEVIINFIFVKALEEGIISLAERKEALLNLDYLVSRARLS